MLPNLNAYPLPRGASATEEVPVMSRLLVHETGHVVVAATAGIPTDYIIIDPHNGRHAGYIDESYRARIAAKPALKSPSSRGARRQRLPRLAPPSCRSRAMISSPSPSTWTSPRATIARIG